MNTYLNSTISGAHADLAECLECRAKLFIYPGTMHPGEVTKMLGVQPTEENIAGTTKTNSLGRVRQITISGWFLISDQEITSLELSDHVDWLLARICPAIDALLTLQRMDGVVMMLEFVWWGNLGRGGPTLRPDQLRALAKLGLELLLSVCYYGDE